MGKKGIIYKWTCNINNKSYIGQTTKIERRKRDFLNFERRYSGRLINKARKKYNKTEYWNYEILEYCNIKDLDKREIYYINLYDSFNPEKGYNLTEGGNYNLRGFKHSEETKKKISEIQIGKKLKEETRNKIKEANSGEKNYWYGKQLTEEHKKKISKAKKGKFTDGAKKMIEYNKIHGVWNKGIQLTKEHKDKLRKANLGKHLTEEHKQKLREANKDFKHTEESKRKISKSKSKPIFQLDLYTNEIIKEWENSIEAAEYLNIQRRNINKCCNGERKSCGGFGWIFKKVS